MPLTHIPSKALFIVLLLTFSPDGAGFYNVAIIDVFYPIHSDQTNRDEALNHNLHATLDLDDDGLPEKIYHGDMVQKLAASSEINFFRYPINNPADALTEIRNNLINLNERKDYADLDALVLSWESSTLISNFPTPLSEENTESYKTIIKTMARNDKQWQTTYDIIILLETLVDKGMKVFTISGNGGRNMVNTFSFARGVTTVGAIEKEMEHFIADNPLVDTYERSAYQIFRVIDASGKTIGYDLDGDKCVDVEIKQLSSYGKNKLDNLPVEHWQQLRGSSFAAPVAMKRALLEELSICSTY